MSNMIYRQLVKHLPNLKRQVSNTGNPQTLDRLKQRIMVESDPMIKAMLESQMKKLEKQAEKKPKAKARSIDPMIAERLYDELSSVVAIMSELAAYNSVRKVAEPEAKPVVKKAAAKKQPAKKTARK